MARPEEKGIRYYSMDTNMLTDRKIQRVTHPHGAVSIAVIIKLWSLGFEENGYYLDLDNNLAFDIAFSLRLEESFVNDVITACIEAYIFDKELFDEYEILTSRRMQENYKSATKKRKNSDIDKRFLLLKEEETEFPEEETPLSEEESTSNVKKVVETQQSKLNKTKVNKIKAKERQGDACAREEQPSNLYRSDLSKIGQAWTECKHGMYSTAVMGMFLEYLEKGISVDVAVYAIQQASGKTVKNVKRYVEAILEDKLARGILTRKQLDEEQKKQAVNFSLLKGEKEQSGYGDTRTKDYA